MKRVYILFFVLFSAVTNFAQPVEAELSYLKAVNAQNEELIRDNIRNALITFDTILIHYPDVSPQSAEFVEELGNSFYQTGAYDKALFLYIAEAALFPTKLVHSSRLHQLDKVYTLLHIPEDKMRRLNSIPQLNPESFTSQRLKAPLLVIKYLNTKGLDNLMRAYIRTLRKKGIIIPKEVQLWEDLVDFKIRRKIRGKYFTTVFTKLETKLKRKYYRKASIYYRKAGNKRFAQSSNEKFKENSTSFFQFLEYRIRKICIGLLYKN